MKLSQHRGKDAISYIPKQQSIKLKKKKDIVDKEP